jgi:hypothetical protein
MAAMMVLSVLSYQSPYVLGLVRQQRRRMTFHARVVHQKLMIQGSHLLGWVGPAGFRSL